MKRLALLLSLVASPAFADMGPPPPQYDIGGATEADAIVNYIDRFGTNAPPLIRVLPGQAKLACDRISLQRYGVRYPESETTDGSTLLGCLIRNEGSDPDPIIVYTFNPSWPELAPQLLRHEVGHLEGWPGDHRR